MHPDNLINTLADRPTFVDRWQCRIGWHRWTKWSDIEQVPGYSSKSQQRCWCVDCNRTKRRIDEI